MTQRKIASGTTALALLLLSGCHHRARVVAPPVVPHVATISVPPPTHRAEPFARMEYEAVPPLTLLLPRRPLPRFRPRPTTAKQLSLLLPAPARPVALGQLTTGGEADSGLRQGTEVLLRSQHQRLNSLPRSSATLHSAEVDQIRLFLQQADDAWQKLDVEGARTLATKAKVLLDEL